MAQSALPDEVDLRLFVTGQSGPSIRSLRVPNARVIDALTVEDLDGDGRRDFRVLIESGAWSPIAYFAVLNQAAGYCATPIAYVATRQSCVFGPPDPYPMTVQVVRAEGRALVAVRTLSRGPNGGTDYVLLSVVGCGHVVERWRETLGEPGLEFVERRGRIALRSRTRALRVLRFDSTGQRMIDARTPIQLRRDPRR